MRAVAVLEARPVTHPEVFVDLELPVPEPGPSDLLVRVEAVSVNPADVRVRQGKAADGEPRVLGWDAAGHVVAVGAAVEGWAPGDPVWYAGDVARPGCDAQLHAVDARIAARRPAGLTAAEAAALPLTTLTAWEALFDRLGFEAFAPAPERVLLAVGGAGGTASAVLQLARLIPGLTIIGTASRPESAAWVRDMGAAHVLDHSRDLQAELQAKGLPAPTDVLLLNAPDQHLEAVARLVAPQGRVCCIVPFLGPTDLNPLMRKSVSFHWELMFTRPIFGTSDLARQGWILGRVAELVEQGSLRTTLTEVVGALSAESLREAHARLESGRTIGKLVLTVP
ncbi:MAG: zinc-binding alcohol dehydrogenase family protein [Myxococcales bacterium]|nr:zinc-binding alcohol dehydrogenase family protein [Myxococcales bacterium]MCB9645186.1 zinc-binding alcohol dehydrogenase family protein [Deltaproteobacteria bacterium]